MATSLKAEDLGATYDFFGGYRDLRRGTVRVLHNLSFVEDPTRLLRAVRYEARLGFRMDAHTLTLAKGCIDMRLVGDLSSARLRDELLVILDEPHVAAALARMAEIGLDRALHPHLDAGPRAVELVESAERVMAAPPFSEARATLVRLACMCTAMPPHELYGWLERLKLRRRDQDVVAAAVTLAPAIVERLSGAGPAPSELQELLAGQAIEVLVLAAASAGSPEVEERLRAYVERVRDARLEISGDDLRDAGVPESPAIGDGAEADAGAEARRVRLGPRGGAADGAAAARPNRQIGSGRARAVERDAVGRRARPLRGLVRHLHRSGDRRRLLDQVHDGRSAARDRGGGDVLPVADGDGPGRPQPRTSGRRSASRCRRCTRPPSPSSCASAMPRSPTEA